MKSRRIHATHGKIRRRFNQWIHLVLLTGLVTSGCVAPVAPDAVTVADAVIVEQRISPVASTPTPTATTEAATATSAPTWTPGPTPTQRKIVVPSGGSSSSVTVRPVTSTPTPTAQPTPTVDATAQAVAEGAAPLIFTGLSIEQKCGRGDVVAVDGHELLATPRLLVDNSNFLELLPEGAQVDILDCLLWNDEEELSWLAVRTAKGKLGWMLLQPDKFYVTLLPVALAPPRSLTAIPAGTTVAYMPPSDCEDAPVSNEALATSIGIDLIPVVGDVKGLGEAATGCDLVTGESLGDWRWFGLLGLIGMSELALARHGDDAVRAGRAANSLDGVLDYGDEAAAFTARNADTAADIARSANKLANAADTTSDVARTAEKSAGLSEEALQVLAKLEQPCSFAGDTPVLTATGLLPIRAIRPETLVWAFDEALGKASYYPVTAAFAHIDPLLLDVTISGETIRTTPEHPFFVDGVWLSAGQIEIDDSVLSASGVSGAVAKIVQVRQPQVMYNITVAQAHTYFVGESGWLVHNACGQKLRRQLLKSDATATRFDAEGVKWQAHHVIPGQLEDNDYVRKAIDDYHWNIDGADNGIALPVSDEIGKTLNMPSHRGPHANYTSGVESELNALQNRALAAESAGTPWTQSQHLDELQKLIKKKQTEILARPPGRLN
jgi:hypothetical protein